MKRLFCIVTTIIIMLTFSSQGKASELGDLESFRESEKDLSLCVDDLRRNLQSIDNKCNYISGKATQLETGVAALEAATDTLETENVDFDHSLTELKTIVTALKRKNNNLNTRAAALEVRNTTLKAEIQDLTARTLTLESVTATLQARITDLETRTAEYRMFFDHVTVDPDDINGLRGPHVIFTGANIHVLRGSSLTDNTDSGSGNLIVGYNEDTFGTPRTGSHNVVVGAEHGYCSHGGFIAGLGNTVSGPYASVSGGAENTASGYASSIRGNHWLEAIGHYSYAPVPDQTAGSH